MVQDCNDLLEDMVSAFENDVEKYSKGDKGMEKLRMGSRVEALMRKENHRVVLLQNSILGVFCLWLQMGAGNRFMRVLTREIVMDILGSLPMIPMNKLDSSNGLREIMEYLGNHNDDESNKEKVSQLVKSWRHIATSQEEK